MKTSLILLLVCCLLASGAVVRCGNGDDTGAVKTMDEYREEAANDITADNAEAELEKLENELEQETP